MYNEILESVRGYISHYQGRLQALVVVVNGDDSYLPQTEEVDLMVDTLAYLLNLESEIMARLGRANNGTVVPIQEYLDGAGDPEGSL